MTLLTSSVFRFLKQTAQDHHAQIRFFVLKSAEKHKFRYQYSASDVEYMMRVTR